MIYVVDKADNKILNRCDAWEANGEERMLNWCLEAGWHIANSEITPMGDMVIWVD